MPAESDEFAYIEWIRGRSAPHPRLSLGIGDDAAAVRFPSPTDCLVAVDVLMEGTHFTVPPATGRQVGRKALAVNLSDIAAMAGRPLAALVALSHNRAHGSEFARDIHDGLQQLAEEFDVAIAGGDTNSWDGPLVVGVTVLGESVGDAPVRRSGARVGDWILATGGFGGSLSGRHLEFRPRVDEALKLHASADLHAMIDVSDGLAADLLHVLDESGVGARVESEAIPIAEAAHAAADGRSPLEHALRDGEDFELLLTVAPEDGRRLLDDPPIAIPLSKIGEITEPGRRELVDGNGNSSPLTPAGWEHRF